MNIVFDWVSADALRAIFAAGGKFGNLKHGYRILHIPIATVDHVLPEEPQGDVNIKLPTGQWLVAVRGANRTKLITEQAYKAEVLPQAA